ncbi:MAG TPA: VIT1/CCC1 transporter family protein [Solirubrobacteraceae bacterium]|nr:VIT1/CCC1 transporter family protein [Solirubrobacteraceae bacterium]
MRCQRDQHDEHQRHQADEEPSDAIYGANDGLAAVFGIVAGVSGAAGGSSFVLTAGLSAAVASALSMATGAFLASRSEAEVVAANVARERQEIAEHPEEEKQELSLFYHSKGSTSTSPTSSRRRWRSIRTRCFRRCRPRSSA